MKTLLSFSLIVLAGHLLMWPASAQERGIGLNAPSASHYYALIIGNNDYQKIRRLQTAETDAREMERMLKTQYGFQTKLLLNATRQQILSALNSYRRILDAEANLLIYYAGHGVNDKEADKAYWLPVDAELDDNANWISADDITTNIKVIPARHVLIVSDSCYSGTLTRGLGEALPRPSEREQFLRKMALGRSRTLMASGGNEPVADGGGGRHSVFAAALLSGLRQMDKPQFTAAELFRLHVEEPVAGRANQTPEYNPLRNSGHESGDFIFVKIKTDGKSVEVTVKAPTAAPSFDPAALELSYWDSIKSSDNPEYFRAYLRDYPNGRFASIARLKLQPTPSATPSPSAHTAANRPGRTGTEGSGAPTVPNTEQQAKARELERLRQEVGEKNVDISAHNDRIGDILARANQAYASKQYEQAIALYDQGITIDPTQHVFFLNKATTLRIRAVEIYNTALRGKDETGKHVARADMRAAVETVGRAWRAYRNEKASGSQLNPASELQCLQARSETYRLALRMASITFSEEVAVAMKEYMEAEIDPAKKLKAHIDLGTMFFDAGLTSRALSVAREILAAHPDNADALYLAGTMLVSEDKKIEARVMLRRFLQTAAPSDQRRTAVQELLDYLR